MVRWFFWAVQNGIGNKQVNNMNKKITLVLLLFLMPCIVSAEILESYSADFKIIDDYTLSSIEYDFISSSNKDLYVVLPKDAWNISLVIDGKELTPDITGNKVKIPVKETTKKVKLAFHTREILDYNSPTGVFFTEIIAPFDTRSIKTTLTLPLGSTLVKSIEESSAKPTRVESDGQYIKLIWEEPDVSKNFKMASLAVFNREADPGVFSDLKTNIMLLSLVLVIIGQIVYLLIYRKSGIKQIETKLSKKFSVEEHLKEDETQIVNVLKLKEGQTSQGTLRVVTGMPKATLSKLLSELEARKVIHKEKDGKKNIVSLREHFRNNRNGGVVL